MLTLLDRYVSRFGDAVKRQGNGWNGPCPLCGGVPGKSDRFMVWPQRSEKLGEICSSHGIAGIWSCRKCGEAGDTIDFLVKAEGFTFREALAELGIAPDNFPGNRRSRFQAPTQLVVQEEKKPAPPLAVWQERAMKLVEEGEKKIWNCAPAIAWLAKRGIDQEAIRVYRIGYLPEENEKYHGRFRPRKAFGLPDKTGADGKNHDKLFIPRGILIPTFSLTGEIANLRIRRHNSDLRDKMPKYMELAGSSRNTFFLASSLPQNLGVYFITEAELDAILIHHLSNGIAGACAVRTNRGKPDPDCRKILESAVRLCIALDYDEAGSEGVDYWLSGFDRAMRWPVAEGKDPGDAFSLGQDLREWIAAGLPASVKLPEETQNGGKSEGNSEKGSMDMAASGMKHLGEGGKALSQFPSEGRARLHERAFADGWLMEMTRWGETQPWPYRFARKEDFTGSEYGAIRAALPKDTELSEVYLEVAAIWLLWREIPVKFISKSDEAGNCQGFHWECDHKWKARNFEKFETFWRYQSVSRPFWDWISYHPANEISSKNLLDLWHLLNEGRQK